MFIICINDLPLRINSISEPALFADDTSVILSNRNFKDLSSVSNLLLCHMITWFAANNLVLNLDETNIMISITKTSSHSVLHIDCKENYIVEIVNAKFLGLQIPNHIKWRNQNEQIILKLNVR